MSKIALLLNEKFCAPLALSGVKIFTADTEEDFLNAISKIKEDENFEIIFVPENIAKKNEKLIDRYEDLNIVILPWIDKGSNYFKKFIENITSKVTGV